MVARVKHGNAAAKKNGKGKRNFNPFPDPKRGKGRSVLKRPSAKKTKAWKEVPYTRHSSKLPSKSDLKLDREKKLVKMLLQDGLLSTWAGKLCPRCGKGTLSSLQGGDNLRHRCNRKNCQVYINPQHLHPLFVDARGTSATSLRTQAAQVEQCAACNPPSSSWSEPQVDRIHGKPSVQCPQEVCRGEGEED